MVQVRAGGSIQARASLHGDPEADCLPFPTAPRSLHPGEAGDCDSRPVISDFLGPGKRLDIACKQVVKMSIKV